MKIASSRYTRAEAHPILDVEIDGVRQRFGTEQKPTLVRHGIVALEGYQSQLPDGRTVTGTDDPHLFRLVTAFGLNCWHGRFEEGPASDRLDPSEIQDLGDRLEDFAMPNSPPWATIVASMAYKAT